MPMTRYLMQPAFWRGVGRVLDLTGGAGVRPDRSGLSPAERDARALTGDWATWAATCAAPCVVSPPK